MPFLEAVRLALSTIRVQKLKSFFTLLGVMIGVMFLIAVVSIVEGMGRYMEEDFAAKLLGVNTYTLRRFPGIQMGNVTQEQWREYVRRPRLYRADAEVVREALPPGTRSAIVSETFVYASSQHARPRQVNAVATDGEYFAIKDYVIEQGRAFSRLEAEHGRPVIVIGQEVAQHFYPNLDPIGRELRIAGIQYEVIGIIETQGSVFGISLDRIAIAPYLSPLSRTTNPRGDIDGLIVQAGSETMSFEAMETTREVMRRERKLPPSQPDNFFMETSDSALAFMAELKGRLTVSPRHSRSSGWWWVRS